jgi:hypothetical protein
VTNLQEMKFLILPLLIISFHSYAQCKTYKISAKGDTINCVDQKNLRQGKWVERFETLRGEPGLEEEGIYKDGKKEGIWRKYTLMGDLLAVERYRWGNKDGKSQYYNIAGLIREESWKAVNPENPYDTIDVYDLYDDRKVSRQVVKIEGSAVKHGTWKYYEGGTGSILKTETYFLDKKEDPNQKFLAGQNGDQVSDTTKTAKAAVKPKPKEVADFEKKNAGKKKVKYIDGKTF